MMDRLVSIPCRIIERHDRAVVAMVGAPARPAIIPLAGVDLEPVADIGAEADSFKASMMLSTAKEIGLV